MDSNIEFKKPDHPSEPRRRLIEAAGELFVERGFQNTTTHEICQKAQVNGAAINYHFGSKEQLYLAVLEEAFRRRDDVNVLNPLLSPEDQFRSLIRLLCMDIFSEDKPAWHKRLVALEMVGPTEALKVVIEKSIRPIFINIVHCIQQVNPELGEEESTLAGINTAGILIHYYKNRPVITELYPAIDYSPEIIEKFVNFICEFTLAAVTNLPVKKTSK